MDIIETSLHGVPLLTVVGEIDHTIGAQLAEAARRAMGSSGSHILLDLELCSYVDSSGLDVIVGLVNQVGPSGWVGVVHSSRMVLRLFGLVGLTGCDAFRVFQSLDQASGAAAAV
jgi:stage II sporulation protein AA (anti-sigma F factor antagonist)